ncbi:MAG: Na(+)-translocating NADH-quinone reductase subunit A [Gammaproteobacteria bacterium]|nr:Na(+)-translocating NADH-quinone reductase subunit A [Gammaproteobacteria bacterium]
MRAQRIVRGLDLPISGAPEQAVFDGPAVSRVAVVGLDYVNLRPTMLVREGDRVRLGQALFEDKKNPGVTFTAPAAGTVAAINRGAKRVLLSVVINVDQSGGGAEDAVDFDAFNRDGLDALEDSQVRGNLIQSGLWSAFRTRPYDKVPKADARPHSIFVNAMDTNPLAADPVTVISTDADAFSDGLRVLSRLSGRVFVCMAEEAGLPVPDNGCCITARFSGPHPAGLPGTHIHFLDPVHAGKTVWRMDYQDVMAVGRLFVDGTLPVARIIALGGPLVKKPRLIKTRLGVYTEDLVDGELHDGKCRVISGSVLSGRRAADALSYLGRYDTQVSVLAESDHRELLGWLSPGRDKYSAINVFVSSVNRKRKFAMTTSQNGSPRAMIPLGHYEEVMPLDILPTQLLRALVVGDTDTAQSLGCLELGEEDLALCSFVCPGKYDYGPALRACLAQIEKGG